MQAAGSHGRIQRHTPIDASGNREARRAWGTNPEAPRFVYHFQPKFYHENI